MVNKRFYILFFLLSMLIGQVLAFSPQDKVKVREFDEQQWEELTDGVNYYEKREERTEDEENTEKREMPRTSNTWFTGMGGGFQIFLYVIIGVILVVILYYLIRSNLFVRNRKVKDKVEYSIEEIDEHIHESDLDRYLRQALESQDFKQALRIYYLKVIKDLSFFNLINWKKEKTNMHYMMEMRSHPSFSSFKELTVVFEKVWYGDFKFGQSEFYEISPKFDSYLKDINHKHK